MGLANLLQGEGKTDDVIALCKRTLALDEWNSQAHSLLGEVYADRKEPAEALPHFEKAVAIQPKLTRNRLNLAGALTEMKQYGRAETLLREIVNEQPRFPLAQFNLGLLHDLADVYNRKRQPDKMVEALRKARSYAPAPRPGR